MRKAATQISPNKSNTTIGMPGFGPAAKRWPDSPNLSLALSPPFARSMSRLFANTASATATSWTPWKSSPISITSIASPTLWASILNPKCAPRSNAGENRAKLSGVSSAEIASRRSRREGAQCHALSRLQQAQPCGKAGLGECLPNIVGAF